MNENNVFEIRTDQHYLDYCKCMQTKYNELKEDFENKKKDFFEKEEILNNKYKLLTERMVILEEIIQNIYGFYNKKKEQGIQSISGFKLQNTMYRSLYSPIYNQSIKHLSINQLRTKNLQLRLRKLEIKRLLRVIYN